MSEKVVGLTDSSVSVKPGEMLVIRLPETATAGYRWRIRSIDPPAMVVEFDSAQPGGPAPGAAGVHEFGLRARGRGVCRVDCELSRAWEPVPQQYYTLTVTVE